MLPSQQDGRPTGRRPPSQHSTQGRFVELTDIEGRSTTAESVTSDGSLKPIGPPVLPPIPRVASQYGNRGPINLSKLERAILSLSVDEEPAETSVQETDMSSTEVPSGHPSPQGDVRSPGSAPSASSSPGSKDAAVGRSRPTRSSSNFSRPLPLGRKPYGEPGSRSPLEKRFSGDGSVPVKPLKSPLSASITAETLHDPQPPTTRTASPPLKTLSMPPPARPAPPVPKSSRMTLPPPIRPPPLPPQLAEMQTISERIMTSPDNEPRRPQSAKSFSRAFSMFRPSTSDGSNVQPNLKDRPSPLPLLLANPHSQSDHHLRPQSAKWSSSDSSASTLSPSMNLGSARHKPAGFNRFNPISLLSRRKSARPSSPSAVEPFSPPLPADFDPTIRGHLVHDFSAPRNKHNASGTEDSGAQRGRADGKQSLSIRKVDLTPPEETGRERRRTPVFTEHFEEDTDSFRLDENDRRNQNSTGIAERVPTNLPNEAVSSLPIFAKRVSQNALSLMPATPPPQRPLPPTPQQTDSSQSTTAQRGPSTVGEIATLSLTGSAPTSRPTMESALAPPSPEKQVAVESRADLEREQSGKLSINSIVLEDGTPSRLRSNASSRFSFDLAGVGSTAQEKLLEDKHRQHAARKARESAVSGMSIVETDDEDNGFDDMDLEVGFEEEIPGMMNDDDFPGAGVVSNFTLPGASESGSGTQMSGGLSNSFNLSMPLQLNVDDSAGQYEHPYAEGVTAVSTQPAANPPTASSDRLRDMELEVARGNFVEDDLYFDDGEIDGADLAAGEKFDESLFDDDTSKIYGIPLRDQPKAAPPQEHINSDSSEPSTRPMSLESTVVAANQAKATADTSRTSVQPNESVILQPKSSIAERIQPTNFDSSAGLTQDNLAAYHDALVYAANKAAKDGRFERKESFTSDQVPGAVSSLPNNLSFNIQDTLGNSHSLAEATSYDDFDGEDDMEDDAIIAAANAEALENDEDGFYGSEFGFYARGESDETASVNGGYFGSNLSELIKRSHSGRAGGQDPSLTPITERSEWSQRNSMISLALHTGGSALNSTVVSPGFIAPGSAPMGLAQLAADAATQAYDEDNMSLSALMRLRRGAFGDSNVSLPSSAGSHKSNSPSANFLRSNSPGTLAALRSPDMLSPQALVIGPGLTSPQSLTGPHGLASPQAFVPHGFTSPHAFAPPQGFAPPRPPALHVQAQGMVLSPTQMTAAGEMPGDVASPVWQSMGGQPSVTSPSIWRAGAKGGHSRTSSGAESITYVKEADGEGGSRWVMEKRRTSEAGEIEVLGRQVLENGRI